MVGKEIIEVPELMYTGMKSDERKSINLGQEAPSVIDGID